MTLSVIDVAYLRPHPLVTDEDNAARLEHLESVAVEVWREETSDPRAARPVLTSMLHKLAERADESLWCIVHVDDVADLGRSMPHVITHLHRITGLGHAVVVADPHAPWWALWDPAHVRLPTDALPPLVSSPALVEHLDMARAQLASERVRIGQDHARDTGSTLGRPHVLDEDGRTQAARRVEGGEHPLEVARSLGVSRSTVMRAWRARTTHATGENTTRGKATPHEPAQEAHHQL